MAKRRGYGEGSISQRANGNYRAQVSLEGRRISKTFQTKREAQDWIRDTLNKIDAGLTFRGANTPLGEFLEQWLTSAKPSLRGSTWIHYEGVVRKYITPGLGGDTKLSHLRAEKVQELYNKLLRQGVGVHTVRSVHIVLRIAMQHAINLELINKNPTTGTIPPAIPFKEMQFYDEDQVNKMLFAARGHRLEALFYLAVTTGMRQSELLGLRWTDLDWLKGTLRIERQLAQSRENMQIVELKTKFSRRVLTLGKNTLDKLHERQELEQVERAFAGERWKENGLIFPSTIGTPYDQRALMRQFKELTDRAGLPEIRFHDLRHTAASLLLNHGMPAFVASKILGHSRPSITLDMYGHLLPSSQLEAAELMNELVTSVEVEIPSEFENS